MNRAGTRDMDTSVIWAEHFPYTYEALDLILTAEKKEIWNVALYFTILKFIIIVCVLMCVNGGQRLLHQF